MCKHWKECDYQSLCFPVNILGCNYSFNIEAEIGLCSENQEIKRQKKEYFSTLFPKMRDIERFKQNSQIQGKKENLILPKFSAR